MAISAFKNRYTPSGKIISDKLFYSVMCLTLLFGFLVNCIEVVFFADYFATWNLGVFLIVYLIMAIGGIIINVVSKNPIISFVGYCLVVLPIGALLSLIVPAYTFDTVISAFAVTALLAAFMSILAIMYPRFFNSLVSILFLSLLVAFIYQLVAILCGFGTGVWYNWLIVLLFGAYVGLDISFAKNRPKTLDNAVDSACGLYLDLINLFVRLLAILGRGNRQ